MGRRRTGAFEDLIDVLARLPWWICIVLALLSYVVLSRLAAPSAPVVIHPGQIGEAITHTMWKSLAMAGQYLLPIACVVAALISVAGQRKRRGLVNAVTRSS